MFEVAIVIDLALGRFSEASVIGALLVFSAGLGFSQERRGRQSRRCARNCRQLHGQSPGAMRGAPSPSQEHNLTVWGHCPEPPAPRSRQGAPAVAAKEVLLPAETIVNGSCQRERLPLARAAVQDDPARRGADRDLGPC
jgi:hypothetical protein